MATKASRRKPTKPAAKKPAAKKPAAKKPVNKPAALVAKYVLQVNSRADAEALPANERKRFAAGAAGIVGGKTLDQTLDKLGEMLMGVIKLQLFRAGTHVYDVWINTVIDDGSVMLANSTKHSGIGISQSRVYDMERDRDAECEAISNAIYKGKVTYPPFEEWQG